jgi:aryl-phospho-beta-D-glucosidase BglC (GH1 family)
MLRPFFRLSVALVALAAASSRVHGATWYLQNNASGDWNTLTNWNSSPFGGGTNPTSISSSDTFDFNGFGVHTPGIKTGTATFGGKELILHGGSAGDITTKTISPASIAIPTLVSDGGTILCAISGATIGINITSFTNNASTTFNGNGNGLGLNLTIGTLTGPGDICAIGTGSGSAGGVVDLNVATSTNFTGTLHIANGCQFTFENALTSGGALEVEGAGTEVTLNYTVTFAGLTINNTVYSPGTYSAATLGFTGSGSVVVQSANVQASPVMELYGVNFSGGESSNRNYPTKAYYWNYYHGKGLNLVRVPFSWEAVQPTLGGALNTTALSSLDKAVSLAAADGMQVILDMHNYDRYTPSGGSATLVGTSPVTYADYQQVWQLLAAHFAGEAGIYGYDIMNEPNGDNGTWVSTTAQYGVNGVRQGDTTHYVIVEGDSYAGAQAWMANNQNLNVTDSANKLIYSAHTYWDSNDSGVYSGSYDSNNDYPNVGVDRVASFLYWLTLKGAQGYVGEFGVPNNVSSPDYRWNNALDNFLSDLNDNGVEGTEWGTYNLSQSYLLRPNLDNGSVCTDAPAMAVLETFGSTPTITSGTPPAGASGTNYSFTFQASDYPDATFSVVSGTLPPGLSLSSAGVLSGALTQTGTYTFAVAASNGVVTVATQTVTLNVAPPAPSADTPTMPPWALGILAMLLVFAASKRLRPQVQR